MKRRLKKCRIVAEYLASERSLNRFYRGLGVKVKVRPHWVWFGELGYQIKVRP